MRWFLAIFALCAVVPFIGCPEYQAEPYAELTLRDEDFGNTPYDGNTFMVGVRYRAPTRITYQPPFRSSDRGDITVNAPAPEPEKGIVEQLGDAGKDDSGNWTALGIVFVLATIGLIIYLKPRRKT